MKISICFYLQVVFLPVDENDSETIDELKIIVNSKYKLWLRELEKIQIDELKEFEQFLYSKMTSDDAGPTSDQLLYDSDSEQMDGSTDQLDDPDRLVVSEQIVFLRCMTNLKKKINNLGVQRKLVRGLTQSLSMRPNTTNIQG